MWSQILLAIILAGAIHGGISFALLFRSSRLSRGNHLLGTLILLIALSNLNIFLLYQQLPPGWQVVGDVVPLVLYMPIGPLLYFYTRTCLDAGFRFGPGQRAHFIPVLLDLFPYLLAACLHAGILAPSKGMFAFIDWYNQFIDLPRWLSLSIYLGLSWKAYRVNKEALARTNIRPILLPFTFFQVIWLLFLCIYLVPGYEPFFLSMGWFPVYLPLSALIYWIGIKGYQVTIATGKPVKGTASSPALAEHKIKEVIEKLRSAMEEDSLYLNPGLTLGILVAHTGLPQKTISAVLNQHLNMSFNEFVNRYRIAAFKEKISVDKMQQYTINSVAMECGFSSQATFQRVFKQLTGLTPSVFLKNSAQI